VQTCTIPCSLFSFSNSPSTILPSAISLQSKTPYQKASLHPNAAHHQKPLFIKKPRPPSVSLLYPVVKKEMEECFLGRGVTLKQKKTVLNNLGKAAELHLASLLSSVAGAVPNLSLQII
jgi:hypothetical protein